MSEYGLNPSFKPECFNRVESGSVPGRIKPAIKQLIVSEAIRYREKPRLILAADIRDTIERIGEVSPSEETLIKMVSDARNKEVSPLDTPWHLGTLDDYPLSAEAIHHILKVQKWMAKKGKKSQVTLRLAKWISRFSKVISKDIAWLWKVSFAYTLFEILCEISDTDFDTSHLDAALMAGMDQFDKIATDLVMLGDIHGAAMYQHEGLGNGKVYKKWAGNEYSQNEVNNERSHNTAE